MGPEASTAVSAVEPWFGGARFQLLRWLLLTATPEVVPPLLDHMLHGAWDSGIDLHSRHRHLMSVALRPAQAPSPRRGHAGRERADGVHPS